MNNEIYMNLMNAFLKLNISYKYANSIGISQFNDDFLNIFESNISWLIIAFASSSVAQVV